MFVERNKELALLMLRNLIHDIEAGHVFIMDVGIETEDPKADLNAGSYVPQEQLIRFRTRFDDSKLRAIADEAGRALELADKRHTCGERRIGKRLIEFVGKRADYFRFACSCGEFIDISGMEVLAK